MNSDSIGGSHPTFKDFWDLGYTKRLIPIVPHDAVLYEESQLARRKDARGKAPGLKRHDGKWGGLDWIHYEADEHDLKRWTEMAAGTGIKTGNGLVLIDADTLNERFALVIRDTIEKHCGPLAVRVGRYPKAGYLLRVSEPFRYCRVEFENPERPKSKNLERVEILSDGRQFVAAGIHPFTKEPYKWPRGIPRYEDIPEVSPDIIKDFLEELCTRLPAAKEIVTEGSTIIRASIDQASLKGDLQKITLAIRALPNTTAIFPTHDDYIKIGYAVKAALPDHPHEAFSLFAEWCDKWEDPPGGEGNDPDHIKGVWRSLKPPFQIGANWLFDLSDKYSGGKFEKSSVFFDIIKEDPASIWDASKKASPERFPFEDFNTVADTGLSRSAKPLIKGLLDQSAMSVLYGDSNVGKTFVAMDMAFHIAAGLSYADLWTAHLPVAYIAAEGGHGARRRIVALRDKFTDQAKQAKFSLLLSPVNLRDPDADLNDLKASLQALADRVGPLGLIVVDTLSRAMAGGDENSSVDMGLLVRHFDDLRSCSGAHLMVVHHTGKDKAKGARGHSILRASTDTELEVVEDEFGVTKQRDLEKSWRTGFVLQKHTLGLDEDGDPITSCTVRLTNKSKLSETQALALSSLRSVCQFGTDTEPAQGSARLADIMTEVGKAATEKAVRRALEELLKTGHVVRKERGLWAVTFPQTYTEKTHARGIGRDDFPGIPPALEGIFI